MGEADRKRAILRRCMMEAGYSVHPEMAPEKEIHKSEGRMVKETIRITMKLDNQEQLSEVLDKIEEALWKLRLGTKYRITDASGRQRYRGEVRPL